MLAAGLGVVVSLLAAFGVSSTPNSKRWSTHAQKLDVIVEKWWYGRPRS